MGALYIKDERTAFLAEQLARELGVTKTEAVRRALEAAEAKLAQERATAPKTGRERMEDFWKRHPLPAATGKVADKAFFDRLWGEE